MFYLNKSRFSQLISQTISEGPIFLLRAFWFIFISHFNRDKLIRLKLFNQEIFVRRNSRKLGIDGYLYAQREAFEKDLQQFFYTNDGFIDVGANYGFWTLFINQNLACKPTCSISIEASKENFDILKENLRTIINKSLFNCAAGDKDGFGFIENSNFDPGSNFISQNSLNKCNQGKSKVKIRTIDSLIDKNNKIGLIKIDIEGYELRALEGAIELINRDKPNIICEIIESYTLRAGYNPKDLINFLGELNYVAHRINLEGLVDESGYTGDGNYYCRYTTEN